MATATKPRRASNRTSSNKPAADTANDEADAAAKQAEADAAAAEKAAMDAKLDDLRGRLSDTLHDIQTADRDNALAVRLYWVKVGDLLNEGRAMFTKGNEVNDKEFGKWISAQGLTSLGARPTRAAAVWLADVYSKNQDLYELLPTESTNGEPLRRSPRTLKDWVRDRVYETFQIAYDAKSDGIDVPSEAGKDEARTVAKAQIGNVYDALDAELDNRLAGKETAAKRLTTAKGKAEADKAAADYSDAVERLSYYENLRAILDAHSQDERENHFAKWRPKRESVAFKDCDVEVAADRLFNLLKSHEEFAAVYKALGVLVDAHAAAVEEAAESDEPDADDFDGDEDTGEDFDGDDFDGDDFDGDDFDGDEGDDDGDDD